MTEFLCALILVDDRQRIGLRQVGDRWEFPMEPTTGTDPRSGGYKIVAESIILTADAAVQMPRGDRTVYVYVGSATLASLEYFTYTETLKKELTEEAKEIVRICLGQDLS
jgi:hypothetical protein